jgi:hypothetical protein
MKVNCKMTSTAMGLGDGEGWPERNTVGKVELDLIGAPLKPIPSDSLRLEIIRTV